MDIKLITSTAGWQYCSLFCHIGKIYFIYFIPVLEYCCCHNDQVKVCGDFIFPYFNPHWYVCLLCTMHSILLFYFRPTEVIVANVEFCHQHLFRRLFSFVYICTGHHHFVLDQGILTMICLNTHWLYVETIPLFVWRYLC